MILVTSGTQLPFDRFIEAVDEAASRYSSKKFLVQAIDLEYKVKSANIELARYISPVEFNDIMINAELIISHAGVGTIISAAKQNKSLIVFPRVGKLKEHRNNHQVATCEAMQKCFPLNVANNASELSKLLDDHFTMGLPLLPAIPAYASDELLTSLKDFIEPDPVVSFI